MRKFFSRRTISGILCFCMLISVLYVNPVFAGTTSSVIMLTNPGFEDPLNNGVIPGWTQIMGAGKIGSVSIKTDDISTTDDDKYMKSDAASLKIYDNDTVNFAVESDKYAARPDVTYTISAGVYIESGSIQLQLRFYDANKALISGGIIVNDPNYTTAPIGSWQTLTLSAKAPANTGYVTIVAVSGKTLKGTSYWDDFQLIEDVVTVDNPELGTFDSLQNPSFESDLADGKIPQWKSINSTQNFMLDAQITNDGTYSLKLDDSTTDEAGVMSNYVTVTPGTTYSASAMAYGSSAGNVEIHLAFYDSSNNIIGTPAIASAAVETSWVPVAVSAAAPEGAAKAAVILYSGTENTGTYYFDKVELNEELPPPAKYYLSNPGFEEPVVDSVIPGWTVKYGDASVSMAEVFDGDKSLYVSNVKTTGKGINMESDLIDVREGETYVLTSDVYLQQGAMQGFYVYVYDDAGNLVKSADGKDYHLYVNATAPAGQWISTENYFTVQPGGKKLKVSLISGNKSSYQFYIDDVNILKAVKNNGFEQDAAGGQIPGWRTFNSATDGNTFGVTGDRYSSGTKSLYLESEPGKYLNVISDLIDVQPGGSYTALAKNYIETGSADMYVRFFDSKGNYINQQVWSIRKDITGSWFTNFIKFTVPENASKIGIMFAGSASKTFKYYVDDVKLLGGNQSVGEEPVPEDSIVNVGQDLGVQIRKATLMRGDYGKDGDGRDVIYTVVMGSPSIFTIIDVETERVVKSIPMPDTSGAWSVKVSTDGTVYLGAYNLGLLYRYFPETGELKNLGNPLPTKDSVLYPMDSGSDGKMYGGNYPTGSLYSYDPATNKFTDFGTMAFTNSGERWSRVTVYDSENNKAYVGVGNQARLVEYDFATGQKRDLLPAKYGNIISVYDLNLANGKLFAKKEANNANEMFVLDAKTGEQIEVTNADTGEKLYDIPNFSRGVSPKSPVDNKIYYAAAGGALYSYDLDTDTIKSLGASIDGAAISYGFVQLHEEGFEDGYSLVGLSGNGGKMYKYNLATGNVKTTNVMVQAEPVNIHDIMKGPDGKIYTTGYLAGNMGVFTPTTGQSIYLDGISQGEGITAINNKIYIGSYPDAKIYEYDLDKPWNRDNSDKLNPNLLFSLKEIDGITGYTLQDRPFGMAGSEDMNKLFVGTVPKNSLLGGAFAVYDLNTREAPDVYWNIVPDQSIISLVYKDGKVYGGTSIYGGQGGSPTADSAVLFVWDVAKGEKTFETVPVPGEHAITALHAGPDGNIWGLADGSIFVFDPNTQTVIYSKNEFPDVADRWISGSMETGTDGNIYATVGGRFFRVDASTKEVTVLATQARKLAQDDFGNFYIYTVPEGTNLYKYSDPNLVLKLIGAELSLDRTELNVGETAGYKLEGLLEKGRTTNELSGARIDYNISDTGVAELKNGSLVAKSAGTVQVYATVTLDGVTVQSNIITVNVTATIESVRSMMEYFIQSGELSGALVPQLTNSLEQAEQFIAKGQMKQAVKHLDDLIKHLNNKAMAANISENAQNILNPSVNSLLNSLSAQ